MKKISVIVVLLSFVGAFALNAQDDKKKDSKKEPAKTETKKGTKKDETKTGTRMAINQKGVPGKKKDIKKEETK